MVANILPLPWSWVQKVTKVYFFRTWPCCISNKMFHECSNMVAKLLHADPPSPQSFEGGVKRSNSTFLEYGHGAYQIKGNDACSNMVAHILHADPARNWGGGSKGPNSTCSEYGHVAYKIKWNHECSNVVAIILPTDPRSPTLERGIQRSNFNFFRIWTYCTSNKRE